MRLKIFGVLIGVIFIGYELCSQHQPNRLSWDLDYQTLLNQHQIRWDHSVGTLFTWLADREQEQAYIKEFVEAELSNYDGAMFMLDHPTFPSGGRTTILGIKRQDQCFYWYRSTDEGMREFKRRNLDPALFDQVMDRLTAMKQKGYENMGGPEKAYAGFLSTYQQGHGKQILLHINDFMEFDTENQQILRVGKIFEIENSLLAKQN